MTHEPGGIILGSLLGGVFETSVCVPSNWTDQQIVEFTNVELPCDDTAWNLAGMDREPCADDSTRIHVHLFRSLKDQP